MATSGVFRKLWAGRCQKNQENIICHRLFCSFVCKIRAVGFHYVFSCSTGEAGYHEIQSETLRSVLRKLGRIQEEKSKEIENCSCAWGLVLTSVHSRRRHNELELTLEAPYRKPPCVFQLDKAIDGNNRQSLLHFYNTLRR